MSEQDSSHPQYDQQSDATPPTTPPAVPPTPEYSVPPAAGEQAYTQPVPQYDYPQQQYDYSQQYDQQQYAQPDYQQAPQAQSYQGYQQAPVDTGWGSREKDKWVAAVLAFVLGALGIHKFYLGYKHEGMIMLLVSIIGAVCTLGLGTMVMGIISLIEAVKYVILTQEDFQATYVTGRKVWF
jgi:TM2 domain-containing membrane protein YozV